MKKVKTLILTVLIAGAGSLYVSGCSDLLDPKVYDSLTPETFFSSESDFDQALVAIYSPFTADWGTSDPGDGVWSAALYNADPKSYLGQSMITTDELHAPYQDDFNNFTWGPATMTISPGQDVFAATFVKSRFIARATDVINQIESSEADVPDHVRDYYIAQAKVLRAWLMYVIYDFHGTIPVKLDPLTMHDTHIDPRPPKEEYIQSIETDLLEAIPYLTPMYNNNSANWGRVSKGTARMLLLRLYMHEHEWAKAEAVARDIMDMGYRLLPDYASVFNEQRNDEIIFAVPAGEAAQNWWIPEVIPSNYSSGIFELTQPGWNVYYMPWDFYDNYEPADHRLETIVDSYQNARGQQVNRESGMQGAIPLKFTGGLTGNPGEGFPHDQPVFRYAETLLSLAEAINEQRGPDEAYTYANEVRERAGLEPFSGLSQAAFRDSLLAERGREFYGEGLRRMDLIRHGRFIENARERGVTNAQDHHVLFPIPQTVIVQSGGAIDQNPGYN
ncbi:RagB/SusD family nutrient uptake outer membrane protein [Balneolales bacterium ANBcel1]|nr:RagB/SusD family nutrient uptake outer membrane protein [Balneolales bacterium ANBcel1]